MADITLYISKAGMLTLIQDTGRPGWQQYGIPAGGALDQSASAIANWLVGNPLHNPVLECTIMGPQIMIGGECQVAITGADLSPTVNGQPVNLYETLHLPPNAVISFGRVKSGCRAYLAIGGQWQVKTWLDSASAAIFSGHDLLPGSHIRPSQAIVVKPHLFIDPKKIDAGEHRQSFYDHHGAVRVVPGPEFSHFSRETIGHFFSSTFRISSDSNRMGCRLEPTIRLQQEMTELISSGTTPGTIQITGSGQPIVLLADAQTTGGYPRMANVITADLDSLAQLKPGDELRFCLVSLEEAHQALMARQDALGFLST